MSWKFKFKTSVSSYMRLLESNPRKCHMFNLNKYIDI